MEKFKIKYKPIFPVFILISSLFIFFIGISIGSPVFITGILLLIFSIVMFINPIIVITSDEFLVKNLLGMTVKKYSYLKSNVEIKSKNIYLNGKKILTGFIAQYDEDSFNTFINEYGGKK